MKYFTKDWCFSKLDDQEIQNRLKSYRDYIQDVYKKLPAVLRMLVEHINLHDGKIALVVFNSEKKELLIRGVFGDLEVGYFFLSIKYLMVLNLDFNLLNSIFISDKLDVLSDEIEYLGDSYFSHRMLFSIKKDIDIQFKDIELEIQNANPRDYEKVRCQFKTV
jgi:hypothetical protein